MFNYQDGIQTRLLDFIRNADANRIDRIELNGVLVTRGLRPHPTPTPDEAYQNALEIIQSTHKNKRHLALDNSGMLDLPPEISELKNLTHLSLRRNFLVALPPEIGSLRKLRVLILSRNQLSSLPPEIAALENISLLDIRDNYFSSIPPEIFRLYGLTRLNASFNIIRSIPSVIGRLSALAYLSLGGNEISSVPAQISKLRNLSYLDLHGNKLTDIPFIAKSSFGLYVDISDNPIPVRKIIKNTVIFLSYSRKDKDKMKLVNNGLEDFGFPVWTDEALIPGTPDWEKELEDNIVRASVFVVILSPNAKTSDWVRMEIAFAQNFDKVILPILCDGDSRSSIPISLINCQYVDGRDDFEAGIKEVIESIRVSFL